MPSGLALLLSALLLGFLPSQPSSADSGQLLRRFESRYRPARTLSAVFRQTYLDGGKTSRVEAGVAYFAKPGKMRWEYQAPEADLYLVDGKWAWFYVPADRTVTRIAAKESADWRTPFALLAGEAKLSRICQSITPAPGNSAVSPDGVAFRCQLKGSPDARGGQSLIFELQRDTGELLRVLVSEPGGVQIEFLFNKWQFDPPLSPDTFRFQPPKGVAIVEGELAAQPSKAR
ncbi:MAG TPA: outer membrane lipoprotein carrier protein LolA [Dongiaceae bacterium]|nr:outer membrane lipoprotein carrier protein LolA [Dongiaceae bacterium]